MKQRQGTAILFFSRSGTAEAVSKHWLGKESERKNVFIANQLIAHTKAVLAATGLPVYHFDEKKQEGKAFGSRLANAFASLFDSGYDYVICVGNDSPGIIELDWQSIESEAQSGQLILGPDYRGGAYLIGLPRELFAAAAFAGLPWKTPDLFLALQKLGDDKVFLLVNLTDLNDASDLARYASDAFGYRPLQPLLRLFFFSSKGFRFGYLQNLNPSIFLSEIGLRAPPSLQNRYLGCCYF